MKDIDVINIRKILEEDKNISFALIFGSYAKEQNNSFSDLDIALHFYNEPDLMEIGKITAKLEKLTSLEVDIIVLNGLYDKNPAFAYEVITTGKLIFCNDEEAYLRYKKNTFLYYFDHLPLFDMVRRDLKRRIRMGKFGKLGNS